MPERPIVMSAESVRAILEGPKTQTRRVVRHPLLTTTNDFDEYDGSGTIDDGSFVWHTVPKSGSRICVKCPYPVGTRLWVKETLNVVDCPGSFGPHYLYAEEAEKYHAITGDEYMAGTSWAHLQGDDFWAGRSCGFRFGVRSPLFMPRWASRITLEVTDVRLQRLWEISPEDVTAEGVPYRQCSPEFPIGTLPWRGDDRWYWGMHDPGLPEGHYVWTTDHLTAFATHWDAINAKRGHPWSQNDWVWAFTFRRTNA